MNGMPSSVEALINKSPQTFMRNEETTSIPKFKAKAGNHVAEVRDCSYEATLVLKGNFDVNVLDKINLEVFCKDGSQHFSTGTYLVLSRVDSIEGDFTTTLKLQKVNGQFEATTMKLVHSGGTGSGNLTYSGMQGGYRQYGVTIPKIEGSGTGADVVREAVQYVGYPYVWGGSNLTGGIDCSHFVWRILQKLGYDYGYHVSSGWRTIGEPVLPMTQAQMGDVMCYNGHVAFFVDGNHIVHARGKKYGIEYTTTNPWSYHGGALTVRRVV